MRRKELLVLIILMTFSIASNFACDQLKQISEDKRMKDVNPLEEPINPYPGVNNFDDIPVPYNATISGSPFIYKRFNLRVLMFNYKTEKRVDQVANYYKEKMPRFGWREISFDLKHDSGLLKFEKEDEKCTIKIEKVQNLVSFTITVNCDIERE